MSINNSYTISKESRSQPLREILQPRNITHDTSVDKIQRRKSFNFNTNSSDDSPSPHASIYEAVHISANSSEDNGHRVELVNIPPRKNTSIAKGRFNDENFRDAQENFKIRSDDAEYFYGHGTVLDTITEQKSFATMRTVARSKSAEDFGSFSSLRPKDSFCLPCSLHKKRSLSVDDLDFTKRSYHEACAMIERSTFKLLPEHQIYAQPKTPIKEPLKRPETPPGMPSWTAAQNLPTSHSGLSESGTQNRLQRRYGLPASKLTYYSQVPQDSTSQVQSNTNHNLNHIVPRFRPPKSSYTSINHHPFLNACLPKARPRSRSHETGSTADRKDYPVGNLYPGNYEMTPHVRFTPSIIARDSETTSYQLGTRNKVASHSASPIYPLKSIVLKRIYSQKKSKKSMTLCPHSKGRKSALRKLNGNESVRSGLNFSKAHVDSLSVNPLLRSAPGSSVPNSSNSFPGLSHSMASTRSTSLCSNAPLMSGARSSSAIEDGFINISEEKVSFCWKCKIDFISNKVDQIWLKTARCLCFICCSFEIDKTDDFETMPHKYDIARPGCYRSSKRRFLLAKDSMILQENFI